MRNIWKRTTQGSEDTSMPKRSILVLVVRHGEREDEVCTDEDYWQMSEQRRFDPALTPTGHSQAYNAFSRIVTALSSVDSINKVAIFSSPLRRAVATTTMIATAAAAAVAAAATMNGENTSNKIPKFVLPIRPSESEKQTEDNEEESESNREKQQVPEIPIVIWNGLCDCAAQIRRMGGHENAIKTGFLSCAATPENVGRRPQKLKTNSNQHEEEEEEEEQRQQHQNPIDITFEEMKDAAWDTTTISNRQRGGGGRGKIDSDILENSFPVQFWQIEKKSKCLLPMTSNPKTLSRQNKVNTNDNNNNNDNNDIEDDNLTSSSSTSPLLSTYDDVGSNDKKKTFGDWPVEEAVRMAIKADCDVCIIGSHREEIRSICTDGLGYHYHRRIPYCGVGQFIVSTGPRDVDGWTELHWLVHDVSHPDMLPENFLEPMVTKMNNL